MANHSVQSRLHRACRDFKWLQVIGSNAQSKDDRHNEELYILANSLMVLSRLYPAHHRQERFLSHSDFFI
jgi:hypothetical protein